MKISKKDALIWFEFFSILPEDEEIMTKQQEIIYSTFAQIEVAIDHRNDTLMSEIRGMKTLENRTFFVGNETFSTFRSLVFEGMVLGILIMYLAYEIWQKVKQ